MNFNILISRAPLRSQAHQGISLFTSTVRRIKGAGQMYRPTADFHILAIKFGPKFHLSLLQHGRGGCNVSSFCKLLKTFLFDRNRTVMLCYVMLCYVMLCYVMLCYMVICKAPLTEGYSEALSA